MGWGRFLEKRDVDHFLSLAKKKTKRILRSSNPRDVKWFVLSDSVQVRERIMKEAGDRFFTYNCTVVHSKSRDLSGWKCSVIENYLLSECDYLILTAKSTFGYLAKHRTEVEQSNIFPKSYYLCSNKECN